jgi:BirA family biotin operon repressor/biotin-[acetyl-CoA-carboxylase] ligase
MANPRENADFARLDLTAISSMLSTRLIGRAPDWPNEIWDSIDSTSNRAAELARQGAPEGLIVLARQQTAGRGRQGRAWVSQMDAGVYMSFLLRPNRHRSDLPLHTLACGVACVEAIAGATGLHIGLKWVNDLVASGKKVGGILAEIPSPSASASPNDSERIALILGIGINLRLDVSTLPEALQGRVESLENLAGQPVDPNALVAAIASRLEQVLRLLEQGQHGRILDAWRQYSITLGREVRAVFGGSDVTGVAVDIDDSGGLIVESSNQKRIVLNAGEISVRNPDGTYA